MAWHLLLHPLPGNTEGGIDLESFQGRFWLKNSNSAISADWWYLRKLQPCKRLLILWLNLYILKTEILLFSKLSCTLKKSWEIVTFSSLISFIFLVKHSRWCSTRHLKSSSYCLVFRRVCRINQKQRLWTRMADLK